MCTFADVDVPDYIDEIQSHVLGIIVGLMHSYQLTTKHVQARSEYVRSLNPNNVSHVYQELVSEEEEEEEAEETEEKDDSSPHESWGDRCYTEVEVVETDQPLYVSTRRQFCETMQKGIKICPRYSTCESIDCKNFHVRSEHICKHVTRGNYCDNNSCDLIVIRACRKGTRCRDAECSFRHQ